MTTKSQTDNTELGEYFSVTEVVKTADNKILARLSTTAKLQIEAMLKQQDIKSRIDELEKWLALVTWPNNYLAMREEMQKHIDELSAKLRSKA